MIYYHLDAVGSVRLITDANGQEIARYDYLPFGEDLPSPPPVRPDEPRRFTGHERDQATGNDYFGARYYRAGSGRFTQADDPAYGDPFDPQSMNRYAYGFNNPVRFVDRDGHAIIDCGYGGCEGIDLRTWAWIIERLTQVQEATQPAAELAWRYLSTPRDIGCMTSATTAGMAVGAAGAAAAVVASGGTAALMAAPLAAYGAATAGGGALGGIGGLSACMSSANGGGGGGAGDGRTSGGARRKLGSLSSRAGEKIADVIRSRGGNASNVGQAGHWADKTLGEAAEAALGGDAAAERAIKIAKQAGRLGQKY